MKEQEPKYEFRDGNIFNRASGEMIPTNEPVMVFRARDKHALAMIHYYRSLVENQEHQIAVDRRIADFSAFAFNHAEQMKEPDTQLNLFG
jgi:hypothetical protein